MGLLCKAVSVGNSGFPGKGAASGEIKAAVEQFQSEYPLFHCIVFNLGEDDPCGFQKKIDGIAGMATSHGSVSICLHGGNCLVLLPGGLDRELFSHRLSKSSGSTVVFQCSMNSAPLALEALEPFIF